MKCLRVFVTIERTFFFMFSHYLRALQFRHIFHRHNHFGYSGFLDTNVYQQWERWGFTRMTKKNHHLQMMWRWIVMWWTLKYTQKITENERKTKKHFPRLFYRYKTFPNNSPRRLLYFESKQSSWTNQIKYVMRYHHHHNCNMWFKFEREIVEISIETRRILLKLHNH